MAADELDQLLDERFGLARADIVAALKTLPAIKPWASTLPEDEVRLLDEANFAADPKAYAVVAADTVARMARLIRTAYSGREVASALGVSRSQIRRQRISRTLWAISHQRRWIFPAAQFEVGKTTGSPIRQVRGLDQVLRALPSDLHPLTVSGFLHTPQIDLQVNNCSQSPLQWLRNGGDVQSVLTLIEAAYRASL